MAPLSAARLAPTGRGRRPLVLAALLAAIAAALATVHSGGGSLTAPGALSAQGATLDVLAGLIQAVPGPGSGRVVYGLRDDHGAPMAVLDPIEDPAGGYLGVYHTLVRRTGAPTYSVLLARSSDLIHWQRLAVLDPADASMPSLVSLGAHAGFLLAYEKGDGPGAPHFIRLRYYRTRADLVAARASASIDLPRSFSAFNDGTPWFRSVRMNGSLAGSTIELGFHYQAAVDGRPGPDREAVGALQGFRHWSAQRAGKLDGLLERQGLSGSHGDSRQFMFAGRPWRVYEASSGITDFGAWHVLLYDMANRRLYPLLMHTVTGPFYTSFGNPSAKVLPAPGGRGSALVVTMFVFSSGPAAREAGELLFYRPF